MQYPSIGEGSFAPNALVQLLVIKVPVIIPAFGCVINGRRELGGVWGA